MIKKALLEFRPSGHCIKMDIEFAKNLKQGDIIWLSDEECDHNTKYYPYLSITPDELSRFSDGWYAVFRRVFWRDQLWVEVVEIHNKHGKPRKDLEFMGISDRDF